MSRVGSQALDRLPWAKASTAAFEKPETVSPDVRRRNPFDRFFGRSGSLNLALFASPPAETLGAIPERQTSP